MSIVTSSFLCPPQCPVWLPTPSPAPSPAVSLTGAEISVNDLPAGAGVPFVHSHKHNEEVYGVLAGRGRAVIDGETVELSAGDWFLKFAMVLPPENLYPQFQTTV